MNVKQEGLGLCKKCHTPIMQAINQPGVKGMCFGCVADAEPKTGRTLIAKELDESINGRVELTAVDEHQVNPSSPIVAPPKPKPIQTNTITLEISLDDLFKGDILLTILRRIYDGLDSMPFSTMKDAKRVMVVQEALEKKMKALKGRTK